MTRRRTPCSGTRTVLRATTAWLLLGVLAGSGPDSHAAALAGRVVRILGGDALVVATDAGAQHRVRLAGIATPGPPDPYGRRAGGRLSDVATGRFAVVELEGASTGGEFLGRVTVAQVDLALDLLRVGLARFCPARLPGALGTYAEPYARAERKARAAGRGLWRSAGTDIPGRPGGFDPDCALPHAAGQGPVAGRAQGR